MLLLGAVVCAPFSGLAEAPAGVFGGAIWVSADRAHPYEPVNLALQAAGADLGPELLQNGTFYQGIKSWTTYVGEIGSGGQVKASGGLLQVDATNAGKTGYISVFQTLPSDSNSTFRGEVRVRAPTGDFPLLQLGFLEQRMGAKEIGITFITKGIGRDWMTFNWTWTRQAASSTILFYLRVQAVEGHSYAVEFSSASVRSSPTFFWEATNGRIVDASGFGARVVFLNTGEQTVTVRASHGNQEIWSAKRSITVSSNPVSATIDVDSAAGLAHPVGFRASVENPQIAFRLADPSFAELGKTWTVGGYNLGGQAKFDSLAGGRLAVTAPASTATGTLTVQQTGPLLTLDPISLTIPVTGPPGQQYSVKFDEKNLTGATATSSFPFASPASGALELSWKPKLAAPAFVTMSIGVGTQLGRATDVQVGFVKVQGGVTPQWIIDGTPVAGQALKVTSYLRPGVRHHVDLSLADPNGPTLHLSKDFDVPAPAYQVPDNFFDTALLGNLAGFSVQRPDLTLGQDSQISNGDFSAGKTSWSLWDKEIEGNVSWQILNEHGQTYSHLEGSAVTSGSIHVSQALGAACRIVACHARVEYRSSGNIAPVVLFVPTVAGAFGSGKSVNIPPSATWQTTVVDLDPAPPGGVWSVYLRANLKAGETGAVDYRNLTIYPRVHANWTIHGPSGTLQASGTAFRPDLAAPGTHYLTVTLTDAWGQVGSLTKPVTVVPARLYRTLAGDVGVKATTASGINATLQLEGDDRIPLWGITLEAELTETAGSLDVMNTTSRGSTYFRFELPTNASLVLAHNGGSNRIEASDLASGLSPPVGFQETTIRYKATGAYLDVRLPVADASIQTATVTLRHGGEISSQQKLQRNGEFFEASIRLPIPVVARTFSAEYQLADVWGDDHVVSSDSTIEVGVFPILVKTIAFVALAALALGASLAIRRWGQRGGDKKGGNLLDP